VLAPSGAFFRRIVTVEAGTKEEAISEAFEDGTIGGFCGNGGNDKLIGVYGSNASIEACDNTCDGITENIKITCEEVENE
jgi:hypothetical protein